MARLICLSLLPGQLLELGGTRYRVQGRAVDQRVVRLCKVGEVQPTLDISMNELGSLLVLEKATLIDDLDIPDPEPGAGERSNEAGGGQESAVKGDDTRATVSRAATDISHMQIARIVDWHGKIYTLKCLMPLGACSPKGAVFRAAVADAGKDLKEWHNAVGLTDVKCWSVWTLYHDLLRWRQQRYNLAAIQRKGVEYIPWERRRSDFYVTAAKLAQEMGLEFPHLSAAAIHKKLNQKLKLDKRSDMEAAR